MKLSKFVFKSARKIIRTFFPFYSEQYVQYYNQEANDYIFERLEHALMANEPLMISKFGTIELNCVNCILQRRALGKAQNLLNGLKGYYDYYVEDALIALQKHAGFFPLDINLINDYVSLVEKDMHEIDILGSYIYGEKFIKDMFAEETVFVNLNGYYAPFLWNEPWTSLLKGKKVLVVHPFTESIKHQYFLNREYLFENPDVLPEFSELILIKAVQTIAGNPTEFDTWFDALHYMENEIDKHEYDVAIIGCGAYGMHLAAHVKRMGKIALHLAGWTQMLFGVYGKRWTTDQPEFSRFINKYWITPNESEKPKDADKVEGGCYW